MERLDKVIGDVVKGLDLFSSLAKGERLREVLIEEIVVEKQVREKESVEEGIDQLVESIKRQGLLQPLVVEERGGKYILVAGERRLTAAKKAGLRSVPVIVLKGISPDTKTVVQLVENIQRKDLKPSEKGKAVCLYLGEKIGTQDPEEIVKLLRRIENNTLKGVPEDFKEAVDFLIKSLGVSLATLINWVLLLTFPDWFIQEVDKPDGKIGLKDIRRFRGTLKKGEDELRKAFEKPKKRDELEVLRKRALKSVKKLIELGDLDWLKENIGSLIR